MRLKPLRRANPKDADLNKVEKYVYEYAEQLNGSDIIVGVRITNVPLQAAADNQVEHKLNRPLLGWMITRIRGQSQVWDLQDTNPLKAQTLLLKCSADVTVDLWCF